MQRRDSLSFTFLAATVLCVVCSLAVSAAAVALRPAQDKNKLLDRQRNILDAAGLAKGEFGLPASELSVKQVGELWERVSVELVDLETGEYDTTKDPKEYDAREAAKKKALSVKVEDEKYSIGIARREKVTPVYFVKRPGSEEIAKVVLPVYGKGLWSTLYGFLALKKDLVTIEGLSFYEHAETPGLGGEVDNPRWKEQWVGNKLYDEKGLPAAEVAKGPAPEGSEYKVDGLSGATITARGVTNLIGYWAGPNGYGPFLEKLKQQIAEGESESK